MFEMKKWMKLSGRHWKREGGKEICYGPGSVMAATEEEIRNHDPQLRAWEKVDDKTPTTGSTDRVRSKEQFLFMMERQSRTLHPELLALGEMISDKAELQVRKTEGLALAKLDLETAIKDWHHENDILPVSKRKSGPPQSEKISRAEAEIALIEMEIKVLEQRLKPASDLEADKKERFEFKRQQKIKEFGTHHPYWKGEAAKDAAAARASKAKPAIGRRSKMAKYDEI